MKTLKLLSSIFAAVVIFVVGYHLTVDATEATQVDQIHLSCWDDQDTSSLGRIRLVLNRSLTGLVWLSTFQGDPSGEGTVKPEHAEDGHSAFFDLQVVTANQSFIAKVPNMVFQPHVRSVTMQIQNGDSKSSMACRKINLMKRQSEQN